MKQTVQYQKKKCTVHALLRAVNSDLFALHRPATFTDCFCASTRVKLYRAVLSVANAYQIEAEYCHSCFLAKREGTCRAIDEHFGRMPHIPLQDDLDESIGKLLRTVCTFRWSLARNFVSITSLSCWRGILAFGRSSPPLLPFFVCKSQLRTLNSRSPPLSPLTLEECEFVADKDDGDAGALRFRLPFLPPSRFLSLLFPCLEFVFIGLCSLCALCAVRSLAALAGTSSALLLAVDELKDRLRSRPDLPTFLVSSSRAW